jgi:predicted DNA binding CopG/RHH family protein
LGRRRLTCHVRVSKETLERLKKVGRKGETYDEIIRRLLDCYEEGK